MTDDEAAALFAELAQMKRDLASLRAHVDAVEAAGHRATYAPQHSPTTIGRHQSPVQMQVLGDLHVGGHAHSSVVGDHRL